MFVDGMPPTLPRSTKQTPSSKQTPGNPRRTMDYVSGPTWMSPVPPWPGQSGAWQPRALLRGSAPSGAKRACQAAAMCLATLREPVKPSQAAARPAKQLPRERESHVYACSEGERRKSRRRAKLESGPQAAALRTLRRLNRSARRRLQALLLLAVRVVNPACPEG